MSMPADMPNNPDASERIRRALVVEDNLSNQAILDAILKSLDFSVSFAADGEKAVEIVQQERFDIILMDIHMPVMDGFAATRKIRELGGWTASVPIIAVTANEMASDPAVFLAAGLDDLVPKPVDTRQFAETVLRYTAQSGE